MAESHADSTDPREGYFCLDYDHRSTDRCARTHTSLYQVLSNGKRENVRTRCEFVVLQCTAVLIAASCTLELSIFRATTAVVVCTHSSSKKV